MKEVDAAIIIEKNGQRVRSEVVWLEHSRVVTTRAVLVDAAGDPLPPFADARPVDMSGSITLQADEEYSDEQALHDIEVFRFRVATELAGHTHVRQLRDRIGPHKTDADQAPPIVTEPRVERPKKKL